MCLDGFSASAGLCAVFFPPSPLKDRVVPDDQALRLMEVLIGWMRTQLLVQGCPCETEGPVVH